MGRESAALKQEHDNASKVGSGAAQLRRKGWEIYIERETRETGDQYLSGELVATIRRV